MAKQNQKIKIKTKKHLAREQREAKQTRTIIIITSVIGAVILGLVGYGIIDQMVIRPRIPVAEVGDTVIRLNEFESQVQYTRLQLLNQIYQYYTYSQQFGEYGSSFLQTAQSIAAQLSQPVSIGNDVLDEMINGILIKEAAEEQGIRVSEEEIDEAIRVAFGFFPDGTPTPTTTATIVSTPTLSETQLALITLTSTPTATELPTETPEVTPSPASKKEEIDETEEEQTGSEDDESIVTEIEHLDVTPTPDISPTPSLTPTLYTTKIFGENIKEFNASYSIYDFDIKNLRDIFEVNLLQDKLIEVISAELEPIKAEVWARHILVETEEEALEVLSKLDEGGDFHELAATYSTDESNSEDGGNLGWFDQNTMVKEFSDAAFNLEEGEISDPVETTFGFHIIQVLGKRESQIPSAEFEGEKQDAFNTWLSEQRDARDDIVIHDEWEEYVPTTPEIPQQLLGALYQ
ncbi:MAG: peptidylprolyl isomerase [Chloroflexota bacterium]|nr:peptidylprolyl isomerase [Chloroflexota bacterium]